MMHSGTTFSISARYSSLRASMSRLSSASSSAVNGLAAGVVVIAMDPIGRSSFVLSAAPSVDFAWL